MFSKIKRETVLNIVYHGIFLVVMYILQANILPWTGIGVVPLLLVVAAAGLSHFADSGRGAIIGLFCGILCDLALGKPTIVYTIVLSIIGLVLGYLGETIFSRRFPSYMLCCFAALAIVSFVQMFSLLFFEKVETFSLVITALMQTVISLIFAVLMYPFVKKLSYRRSRR